MSQLVYPVLPGLTYPVNKQPEWKTTVNETASGREFRAALMVYPRMTYQLKYEFLRDAAAYVEAQNLLGFFNQVNGDFDTFLFSDPDDNTVASQVFALGDGATTAFQLVRSQGGFASPVYDLNGTPSIFKNENDWRGTVQMFTTPRTNMVWPSQNFVSGSGWTLNQCTVTAGSLAPDGTFTAHKIKTNAFTGRISISRSVNVVSGVQYTESWYVKAAEWGFATVFLDSASWVEASFPGSSAVVNLSTGAITGGQAALVSATSIGSGWWRIDVTATASATTSTLVEICPFNSSTPNVNSVPGDGTSGVLVWGAQMEAAANPTPYIPTVTGAVTVTDCTVSASGVITFASAPKLAASLSWSGSYYWRCRFTTPQLQASKFFNGFWEAGKVEFRTVKP